MKKIIRTTNINGNGITETENINVGPCDFPFKWYKDPKKRQGKKDYDWYKCIYGDPFNGKWCATKKTSRGTPSKIGYCIEESEHPKLTKKQSPRRVNSLGRESLESIESKFYNRYLICF